MSAPPPDVTFIDLDDVDSTNEAAKRLLTSSGPPLTTVTCVTAREQTAGKGTRGRGWHSPRDAGVYLSLVVPGSVAALPVSGLYTLAAGVAAAECIERVAGVSPALKPVNDIMLDGRKLGGILTEGTVRGDRLEHLIVGVGLNVARAERPVGAAAPPATALEDHLSPVSFAALDRRALAGALAERLVVWIARAAGGDTMIIRAAWEQRREHGGSGTRLSPSR